VGWGEGPLVSGAIGSGDPETIEQAKSVYFRHYLEHGLNMIPLFPHVREMLEHFKEKTKIILSNKQDEFIKIILANCGISDCFAEVHGGDTAPCLKPDPCTVIEILKRRKVVPERVLLVGDMTIDLETGKNAGIKTCAVTYGFDSREKLLDARPDFMIDDISELAKIVL
jgi:phosphoglycolate phosphatase